MSISIEEIKQKVCAAGKQLLQEGLVARTWGNVSMRVNDHQMVITPSGRKYDELNLDDIRYFLMRYVHYTPYD